MEILYVEDEQNKAHQVMQVIKDNIPSANIYLRNSYNAALMEINRETLDLVLLDMSLPLYDISKCMEYEEDNDFETFAGIDLLEELVRLDSTKKVIIITAFDVLGCLIFLLLTPRECILYPQIGQKCTIGGVSRKSVFV